MTLCKTVVQYHHQYIDLNTIQPPYSNLPRCVSVYVLCVFQFSSVQSLNRVRLFATLWIAAHQASLSITISRSLPKLMSIESVMHLVLYNFVTCVGSCMNYRSQDTEQLHKYSFSNHTHSLPVTPTPTPDNHSSKFFVISKMLQGKSHLVYNLLTYFCYFSHSV